MQSQVRFLVALGMAAGACIARYGLGVSELPVGLILALSTALAVVNTPFFLIARCHRDLERRVKAYRRLMLLMHTTISIDFIFLTIMLWLVGGAKSPFQAFYLLHVILACVLLPPRGAAIQAFFGYSLFTGLVLLQWYRGCASDCWPVGLVNSAEPLNGAYVLTVLSVQALLITLALFFLTGLIKLLRQGEHQVRITNAELEYMTKLQRDFLHIALHDLKAPLHAATMLIESLEIASQPPLTENQKDWLERVKGRINESLSFLNDFNMLAALDSSELIKQAKPMDLERIVQEVADTYRELAHQHQHELLCTITRPLPQVTGIPRLIREAISNLVTNAVKYTPKGGRIVLSACCIGKTVRILVEDNGIGIAAENQNHLFEEFVRVREKHPKLDKVAGTGLGLSIVRRVVVAHGGNVMVCSVPGEGSVFTIQLPANAPESAQKTENNASTDTKNGNRP